MALFAIGLWPELALFLTTLIENGSLLVESSGFHSLDGNLDGLRCRRAG